MCVLFWWQMTKELHEVDLLKLRNATLDLDLRSKDLGLDLDLVSETCLDLGHQDTQNVKCNYSSLSGLQSGKTSAWLFSSQDPDFHWITIPTHSLSVILVEVTKAICGFLLHKDWPNPLWQINPKLCKPRLSPRKTPDSKTSANALKTIIPTWKSPTQQMTWMPIKGAQIQTIKVNIESVVNP